MKLKSLFKTYQWYFIGLCIAAEVIILSFAFIQFIQPILDSMGGFGELLKYIASAILPASGAWKKFELWKFVSKLAFATHLKIIAAMLFLVSAAYFTIKPLLPLKPNGSTN